MAIALLFVAACIVPVFANTGMLCHQHPLANIAKKGVLIRSWSYSPQKYGKMYWTQSTYKPRYQYWKHQYIPLGERQSTKYKNLDLFVTNTDSVPRRNFCTLHFQRRAKVYLLIHAWVRGNPRAALAGWRSEGWAELKHHRREKPMVTIGLGKRKVKMNLPRRAYVFSRVGKSVTIPTHQVLGKSITGMRLSGRWSLLVAEENGSASIVPRSPFGMKIPAGGRCPNALHDKWVTPGTDPADPQTRRRMFKTFHPLWDPCYWCAYDHEHGSDAKSLMGYAPKYGYTALKNGNENESHKGFKDIVMEVGGKLVYYGLHGHMSKGRRFGARHHTQVMAVVDKRWKGKLELELSSKADYGHREARLATKKGHLPLTPADKALRDAINSGAQPRNQRVINVFNPGNLDRRLHYRVAPGQRRGEYEQWSTTPMCSSVRRNGEPRVDFKDMGLALRTVSSRPNDVVELGIYRNGVFYQEPSTNREFQSKNFLVADTLCLFSLQNIKGVPQLSGKFYTDKYGKTILGGPGPAAVAQFVKPGFKLSITGRFQATDTWYGLYQAGKQGSMKNVGYGVLESEN